MSSTVKISFHLNGEPVEAEVAADQTLLDVLRDRLLLTGTKAGCRVGECGACTVLVEGEPVLACLTLAARAHGKRVETVEGLAAGGSLHPIQKAFLDQDAVACGFCTPGMIMSAKALLDRRPDPTDEEIKLAISGNLCRCTGYVPIVRAIRQASEELDKK